MLQKIIEGLIQKEETIWLEFKSYWYWTEREKPSSKSWGEFQKDLSGLFNTYPEQQDGKKYLIIGFDERSKKTQNFNIDKNGEKLSCFNNLETFKETVISKLKRNFVNTPSYRRSNELPEIESLFHIDEVSIYGYKLLIFTIHPSPYLLEIKGELAGFKEGSIISRRLKIDKTPEVCNTNHDSIENLKAIVKEVQEKDYPDKDVSITKVVQSFREKYCPQSVFKNEHNKRDYTSNIHFEIFTLDGGKYGKTVTFIYFSKQTAQKKTVDHLCQRKLLSESHQNIVLTDKYNTKGGEINTEGIRKLFKEVGEIDVEVSHLEDFALDELYSDLFDPQIFHQGNFNITDFIKPYTESSDEKTADTLLAEWYESPRKPLIVLKGMGGIGKTTVIKYFLDELYSHSRKTINILFINSHEIINDVMRRDKIKSIFDF